MKRVILSSLLAVAMLATGCANQTSPITLQKFYPLSSSCDTEEFSEDRYAPNGYLDVAWGNPTYVIGLRIQGTEAFEQPGVTVGGNQLEAENRNQAVIRRIVLNYRPSRPLGASIPEYVIPYTGVVGNDINALVQLISPELSQALSDSLAPANDFSEIVDINIDVRLEGEMSGSRNEIVTNELTFPLRVYKSAPTLSCMYGYQRFGVDPATGRVSTCLYSGQGFNQFVQPSMPAASTDCCPSLGAEGC